MDLKSAGTRSKCQSVNEQLSGRMFLKNVYKDDILLEKSHHQVNPNGGIQVL